MQALTPLRRFAPRFVFTYGMLIYKQLGSSAQQEFSKSWGGATLLARIPSARQLLCPFAPLTLRLPAVGYALNNVSEFQDVAITAAKAALLIVILDALRFSKSSSWFEECVARAARAAATHAAPVDVAHALT